MTDPGGGAIADYTDRFGNDVRHFDVLGAHDELTVIARREVSTAARFRADDQSPTVLDRYDFLRPSTYVELEGDGRTLAAEVPGADGSQEVALGLMAAVADRLVYDAAATDVWTHAGEALGRGRGVCQDFSHVLIGACRSRGLPARYVSGYLLDPDRGEEHSASHAWVDVLTEEEGWLSLDPTHRCEQNERYVRIATGRDYADVPPTRGIFTGSARETLTVSVKLRVL